MHPFRACQWKQVTTTKDTKSTKKSENETLDAIFQFGDVEVNQQTDLHASQFHVGQELSLVNSLDLVNTLEFQDQFVFYQNVNSVSTIEPDVLVLYRLGVLELECDPVAIEFMR